MPLMDAPETVERTLLDLAIALSAGALVTWFTIVFPDPGPAVALPDLGGVPPAVWLPLVLSVACYPLVRRIRHGGQ